MKPPAIASDGPRGRPASDDYSGPRSPLRVMQIVELLAGANGGLSLAAMTEALQIPKTSLLNHLRVMVGGRLREPARRPLHARTGGDAAGRDHCRRRRRAGGLAPGGADLVARSGETAMLATLDERNAEALYIDVVNSPQDIRYSPRVGSRWPLYCTGIGRALLAFQERSSSALPGQRPTSLRAHRRSPSPSGPDCAASSTTCAVPVSCVTQGEHTVGAGAVAAPIIERDGRVRHAIGIGVPIARLGPRRELLAGLVAEAARQVSWTLGGQAAMHGRACRRDSRKTPGSRRHR
jgi:IclR family acetate operon transcriptional repressor